MSNFQSSFHVIDLKLDVEPSLVHVHRRLSACSAAAIAAASCSTMRGGA